jgi:2-haloacid dehalogenase
VILTFDCYGTLVDWETGITEALRPLLARSGKGLSRDQVLETFARLEAAQEAETPSMIYSELLSVVHTRMAKEWGTEPNGRRKRGIRAFGSKLAGVSRFARSPAIPQV